MARRLTSWLRAYTSWTAHTEAPTSFHFWTGVATIASALRRRVWFDQVHYKLIPNFYIILVAPPGVATKSTTVGLGRKLLTGIKGVYFGPDSMTWQGLGSVFKEAGQYFGPETERIYTMPIACYTSELGTFLRPDDNGLVSFLTDVWDGRENYIHRTREETNAIILERPCITLLGGTTPQWITTHFPAELLNEGLGSRVVFVFADKKQQLVAYPERRPDYDQLGDDLKADLISISELQGIFHLAPEARTWGTQWYADLHKKEKPSSMANDQYDGYFSRKQSHLHKLAMILSVAERDDLIITEEHLKEADMHLRDNELPMSRLFNNVHIAPESKRLGVILSILNSSGGSLTSKQLILACVGRMTSHEYHETIKFAILSGALVFRQNKIWVNEPAGPQSS